MISALICACLLYVIWRVWFRRRPLDEPPEFPGRLPLVGHGHMMLGGDIKLCKFVTQVTDHCLQKGGVTTVDIGLRKMYVVADPEDCLKLSNACLEKEPTIYKMATPIFGNGLVLSEVSKWKIHRRLLNPAFSQTALNGFLGIFNRQARSLADQLRRHVGESFDHETILKLNNLETICNTATGVATEEYKHLQNGYVEEVFKLFNLVTERVAKFWLHNDYIYKFSSMKKELDDSVTTYRELSDRIIELKKIELKNRNNESDKRKPFLEHMLDLANTTGCFSDDDIRAETSTIIITGHDTSATMLTVIFTVLGSYPEVQRKVYEEVLEVIGSNGDLDKDDLSKLEYTEAVIKETLRVFPLVPTIARYANNAVKLKNYTIPAGSRCILMLGGVDRHPTLWGPDAKQFRPERWLDAASLPEAKYCAAFSLGRRSCIGKVYAMMSMKTVVAHVVRRYRITADISDVVFKFNIVTKPDSGHNITLELREDN